MTAPLTILFVDDDPFFCEYFQGLAKPYNLVLHMANTFQDGKSFIESGKAQAYIIDANLPDGSGFELAELVRKKFGTQVPVAVISGVFRDSSYFKQLKEVLKIDYVIDKPIAPEEVRQLLFELCPGQVPSVTDDEPIARLKVKYEAMIPSILGELEQLIKELKSKKDETSINHLKLAVHKIAGNAGSFGYPAVSDLCKRWENSLKDRLAHINQDPLLTDDWLQSMDHLLSKVKFYLQVGQKPDFEKSQIFSHDQSVVKRLPLYVVDSDRAFLGALETEQTDYPYQVTTEWDPQKAMKLLDDPTFNPRVFIVSDTYKGSHLRGQDLIQAMREKKGRSPTVFGLILEKEDHKKRNEAIQQGITYVLEKPIASKLLLNTVEGALHFEEHPDFKVLIVDDDPLVCQFIEAALDEIGISHRTLMEGTQLYEVIKSYSPNLLLLDIYLPGQNGVELMRTLKSDVRFQNLLIVVITASQDQELLSDAYTENVDDILHKPLTKKIIQTRVQSLAKKQAHLDQFEKIDLVTGLPNQLAFQSHVHEKLLSAQYTRRGVFLALIEIDQFHFVKNSETGDALLSQFSNLLIANEQYLGFESYWGNGKFATMSDTTDLHTYRRRLEVILEQARQEIKPPAGTINCFTFSCGLTSMPIKYTSNLKVISTAEEALSQAKKLGDEHPIKIVPLLHEASNEVEKRQVILIDQDESLQQILRSSFEAKGMSVTTYQLGEKFLEDIFLKQQLLPPLVIMERRLPDMDGIDLLRRLHRRYPIQLPIIFLSSLSSDKDVLDGLKAGALDYITKPFNLHQLIQKSIAALRR